MLTGERNINLSTIRHISDQVPNVLEAERV